MGKRGPKPKPKVAVKWSKDFAYALGLLATDGCLSGDGRHIEFTSKDLDQVINLCNCLNIKPDISKKSNGHGQLAFRVQFSDVTFYHWLNKIGITAKKSQTIGVVGIPTKYFFDFLCGCFDGDGSSYSYWDRRWKSSYMFYVGFASASRDFISWLKSGVQTLGGINGHVTENGGRDVCYQLKYSKREAVKLVKRMYKKRLCMSDEEKIED